jgi:hypothetical protein
MSSEKRAAVELLLIEASHDLDPIEVFFRNYEPGRGMMVVQCHALAWCAYWGSMGLNTVQQFVCSCDSQYVTNVLIRGCGMTKKSDEAYVARIVTAIQTALANIGPTP